MTLEIDNPIDITIKNNDKTQENISQNTEYENEPVIKTKSNVAK
jgi:hypothetical protein